MKSQLRKKILQQRKNLTQEEQKINTEKIIEKLLTLKEIKNAKHILIYYPIHNEPNPLPLIKKLKNKTFYLPKLINNKITPIKIDNINNLKKGKYNIKEPTSNKEATTIDLAIIPGIVFSENKHRIGYGKGYYDKYLNNKKITKIAIAYNFQIVKNIEGEKHDIKMDKIITQTRIIN